MQRLASVAERSFPRTAGLEDRYLDLAPDLMAGVTPDKVRDAFLRAVTPKPLPRVHLDHVAPIRASVADAVGKYGRTEAGRQLQSAVVVGARCAIGFGGVGLILGRFRPKQK
jgi:hypothetical protein